MHEALLDHEMSVIRYTFATLPVTENQYVALNGIDAFVNVLNQEEKKRNKTSSPYRLFLHNTMLVNVFRSNIEDVLKKYEVKKLGLVDLLFIPVLQGDHFYCMCFHMKRGQVELIDNSTIEQEFDDRYKGLPKTLRRVLVLYLKKTLKPTTAIKLL